VQLGLVSNLNRPDGNATGVATLINTLVPKQLELLSELVPMTALVGFLVNPTNPNAETETRTVKLAAGTTRQQIIVLHASKESEIDSAFATLANSAQVHCWSRAIRFYSVSVTKSSRSLPATPSQRSMG
jgi:putative ABC transport system substrate-binding protein